MVQISLNQTDELSFFILVPHRYGKGAAPSLKEASLAFYRGQRVLLVGANGSCKSTVMAILGGKRLVPRGGADVLGRDCFNDGSHGEVRWRVVLVCKHFSGVFE